LIAQQIKRTLRGYSAAAVFGTGPLPPNVEIDPASYSSVITTASNSIQSMDALYANTPGTYCLFSDSAIYFALLSAAAPPVIQINIPSELQDMRVADCNIDLVSTVGPSYITNTSLARPTAGATVSISAPANPDPFRLNSNGKSTVHLGTLTLDAPAWAPTSTSYLVRVKGKFFNPPNTRFPSWRMHKREDPFDVYLNELYNVAYQNAEAGRYTPLFDQAMNTLITSIVNEINLLDPSFNIKYIGGVRLPSVSMMMGDIIKALKAAPPATRINTDKAMDHAYRMVTMFLLLTS